MKARLTFVITFVLPIATWGQIQIKKTDLCPHKEYVEIKNGHECVDLGLPSGIKWSTCNVGASSPSDFGDYYAWGEIQPKSEYTWKNYMYHDTELKNIFDAVRLLWHGMWRMPTSEEFGELAKYCKWTQVVLEGHPGVLITGKNGNSVFLPAAGIFHESGKILVGEEGRYWTSSTTKDGKAIYFKTKDAQKENYTRSCGFTIRPVTK